ncbi:MAG: hypothetical protein HS108_06245 [Planctomycetes bacterium]|jgi:hypothetical protein|nr:hypothetical protein [Planctomycetota bacterium]
MATSLTHTVEAAAVNVAPPAAHTTQPAEPALNMLRQAARLVLGHDNFEEVIQTSRRGGLALVRQEAELKVFKLINCQADWKKRWARRVGWNPARHARKISKRLKQSGMPICAVEEHGSASLKDAPRAVWTVSAYIPDGKTLRQIKLELQPGRRKAVHPMVLRLFEDALRLLRRIHDAGFEHRDYHAGNLLISPADAQSLAEGRAHMRLVDLETVVVRQATPVRRARDLRRFIENFVEPEDFQSQIDHALEVYAAGDPALAESIRGTRRMAGLIRKRGITRGDPTL